MTPGEMVDGAVGDANPQIADIELECVHAREQHERATGIHLLCKVFGEHGGPDDLGVERQLQILALEVPVLVDADGLNLLAKRRELLVGRRAPTVLTPHDREFARVFFEVGSDRIGAARRAADDSGAVVLLKGFATVIAEPGTGGRPGRIALNDTGGAALATAGSGDVLAGIITGLLAQHMPAFEAACAGAWLHGEAGNEVGPGLISEDLLEVLPALLGRGLWGMACVCVGIHDLSLSRTFR